MHKYRAETLSILSIDFFGVLVYTNNNDREQRPAHKRPQKRKRTMTIKAKIYDGCKYNETSKKIAEHIYKDVWAFEVKKISAEEIYNMGFDKTDDFNEYAIVTFTDGTTATFRNSRVDFFRA